MTELDRAEPNYLLAASACTTWHSTFEADLRDYAAVGLAGIGLWESKLTKGEERAAVRTLRQSGLKATFCFPEVPSPLAGDTLFARPRDPAERIALMCDGIRRLSAFEPVAVACYAGPYGQLGEAEARKWVVEGLAQGGAVAQESGTRLALEVLRPSKGGSLASSVSEAVALIADAGADNVDVLVDVWHAWSIPLFLDELYRFRDVIVGIQVCDRPEAPRTWMDRRIPGHGALPLREILATARETGFTGWFEIEIFSDDGTFGADFADSLWKRPPRSLLTDCAEAFGTLWDDAHPAGPDGP